MASDIIGSMPGQPMAATTGTSPTEPIVKAFYVAYEAHKKYYRKGTAIPYIVHPMDVASILMKNGAPEHVVVAGLLHDTVEDTDMAIDGIREQFGSNVAELVKGATEPEKLVKGVTDIEKKKTWKERKQHTISFITGAWREMKMLSCADKLANISDMIREYALFGEELWGRFNATKAEQKWYYTSMLKALAAGEGSVADLPMYKELGRCVESMFGRG